MSTLDIQLYEDTYKSILLRVKRYVDDAHVEVLY